MFGKYFPVYSFSITLLVFVHLKKTATPPILQTGFVPEKPPPICLSRDFQELSNFLLVQHSFIVLSSPQVTTVCQVLSAICDKQDLKKKSVPQAASR